jgi:hypothetical protein
MVTTLAMSKKIRGKKPHAQTLVHSLLFLGIKSKPARLFFSVFFSKFLKQVHWRGSSELISIKWRLSKLGCSIFLQKCCYKWRLRKCLGLEVAILFLFFQKNGEKNPLKSEIFLFVPFPGKKKIRQKKLK